MYTHNDNVIGTKFKLLEQAVSNLVENGKGFQRKGCLSGILHDKHEFDRCLGKTE